MDWGWKVLRIGILTRQGTCSLDGWLCIASNNAWRGKESWCNVPLCCIESNYLHERAAEIGAVWSIELLQLQHEGATPELGFSKGYSLILWAFWIAHHTDGKHYPHANTASPWPCGSTLINLGLPEEILPCRLQKKLRKHQSIDLGKLDILIFDLDAG